MKFPQTISGKKILFEEGNPMRRKSLVIALILGLSMSVCTDAQDSAPKSFVNSLGMKMIFVAGKALLIGILILLVGRRKHVVAVFGLFRVRGEAFSSSLRTFRPGFCDGNTL